MGQLEIPRLEISAVVVEGDDDRALRRAVGHLSKSAQPGEPGRVVLAGHRDTFFRNLRWVRKGDAVRMSTPHGSHLYEVRMVQIVAPDDTTAIAPSHGEILTLVTCYPFGFLGPAPYRFLVHAVARNTTSGLRQAAHRSFD
ncbi:MAG: class D sortase [Bryobacterales bacterium]|nr:class D sortase [Bryobacterales bacterium]